MKTKVSRPLDYHGRHALQQADQAIKKDVVRALVELITNSDDSYRKQEVRNQHVDGRIIVRIQPKRNSPTTIVIQDFAQGMDSDALDRAVGTYADETSGFLTGEPVRGYFGRGLKDAILGLGEGLVTSNVDSWAYEAWLGHKR